jgi:WD40 repeat protein
MKQKMIRFFLSILALGFGFPFAAQAAPRICIKAQSLEAKLDARLDALVELSYRIQIRDFPNEEQLQSSIRYLSREMDSLQKSFPGLNVGGMFRGKWKTQLPQLKARHAEKERERKEEDAKARQTAEQTLVWRNEVVWDHPSSHAMTVETTWATEDGKVLTVAGSKSPYNALNIWDIQAGPNGQIIERPGIWYSVNKGKKSNDRFLFSFDKAGERLQIWDLSRNNLLIDSVIPGMRSVREFSSDLQKTMEQESNEIRVWDNKTGKLLLETPKGYVSGEPQLLSDGQYLLTSEQKTVPSEKEGKLFDLWEIATGRRTRIRAFPPLEKSQPFIYSHPQSPYLSPTVEPGKPIPIYDARTGKEIFQIPDLGGYANNQSQMIGSKWMQVAFKNDSGYWLQVWNLETQTLVYEKNHPKWIFGKFHQGRLVLDIGSEALEVFDLDQKRVVLNSAVDGIQMRPGGSSAGISEGGRYFYLMIEGGHMQIWDLQTRQMMLQFYDEQICQTTNGNVDNIRLSTDGQYLTHRKYVDGKPHVFVHRLIHSLGYLP